uniref:Uncharacterized protein n=1 Tax=Anguilla anguilla TaxID=7936 RepID=A0A0E9R8S4_ANGAN
MSEKRNRQVMSPVFTKLNLSLEGGKARGPN